MFPSPSPSSSTAKKPHARYALSRRHPHPFPPHPRHQPRLPYHYIVPLPEFLAQRLGAAPSSKKVVSAYFSLLERTGPELPLLLDTPANRLAALGPIGDSILHVRQGRVIREGGYDGEYGAIRVTPD